MIFLGKSSAHKAMHSTEPNSSLPTLSDSGFHHWTALELWLIFFFFLLRLILCYSLSFRFRRLIQALFLMQTFATQIVVAKGVLKESTTTFSTFTNAIGVDAAFAHRAFHPMIEEFVSLLRNRRWQNETQECCFSKC